MFIVSMVDAHVQGQQVDTEVTSDCEVATPLAECVLSC